MLAKVTLTLCSLANKAFYIRNTKRIVILVFHYLGIVSSLFKLNLASYFKTIFVLCSADMMQILVVRLWKGNYSLRDGPLDFNSAPIGYKTQDLCRFGFIWASAVYFSTTYSHFTIIILTRLIYLATNYQYFFPQSQKQAIFVLTMYVK